MKLITLNLWGGKLYESLMTFIQKYSKDVDIFCFQDALFGSQPEFSPVQKGRLNLYDELRAVLSDFDSFVHKDPAESFIHGEFLDPEVGCGQVIFVRKNITILESGHFKSHPEQSYTRGGDMLSGKCQWVKLALSSEESITVLNLHGLWKNKSQKKDIPERLEQSKVINQFLASHTGKKILCGDFNIVNDGNAMNMLEENMINLIKKYNIPSTRNHHYPKEEKFADYVLVSGDINVREFEALPDEVSDHLALLVEFE